MSGRKPTTLDNSTCSSTSARSYYNRKRHEELVVCSFFFGSPYGFMHEEQKIDSYPNITPNSKQFESLYCHVEVVKATPTRTYFGEIFLKLLFEWFCFLHPSPSLAQDLFLGKKKCDS